MPFGSEFSFMQRGVASFFTIAWMMYHMHSAERFAALRWNRIRRLEIKSLMTILFIACLLLILSYDILVVFLKYTEGFFYVPTTGMIIEKPSQLWSPRDQRLERVALYLLMVYFVVENTGLFLMQNFWNYLTTTMIRTEFIASWHFKMNYMFAAAAAVVFPLTAYLERDNPLERETVPYLIAVLCNVVILLYGVRAHFRFGQLIRHQHRANANTVTVAKLKYYRDMNCIFMIGVFVTVLGIVLLASDALTKAKTINSSKAVTDLILSLMVYAHAVAYTTIVLIFYPHKVFKLNTSQSSTSSRQKQLVETSKVSTINHNAIAIQVEVRAFTEPGNTVSISQDSAFTEPASMASTSRETYNDTSKPTKDDDTNTNFI